MSCLKPIISEMIAHPTLLSYIMEEIARTYAY